MLFPRRRWCQCLMCGSLAMQESAEKLPLGKEEHADVPKVLPFQWWCLTSAVVTADMFWWTNDRSHAFSRRRWCCLLGEREREHGGRNPRNTRFCVCLCPRRRAPRSHLWGRSSILMYPRCFFAMVVCRKCCSYCGHVLVDQRPITCFFVSQMVSFVERERESTGEGTHITRGSVCVSVATQESAEKPPLEEQRPDVPKVLQTIPLRSVFSRRC